MSKKIINIKNLEKNYPNSFGKRSVEVIKNLNLSVYEGEFLILLGPSGCGKSTFLRIIAQLDTYNSGEIEYAKKFNMKDIAFVFQNFGILPWLTVYENISLNLIGAGKAKKKIEKSVNEIIKTFGLQAFKNRYPHELSGGMKQRVGLARAFVSNPKIIFLDEPFSELDFFTASELREVLLNMWKKFNTTVVMVSHYVDESVILADRIAVFSDRPSKIISVIDNNLARPRNSRSKDFYDKEDEITNLLKSKYVV